jgi:hypothetical protein
MKWNEKDEIDETDETCIGQWMSIWANKRVIG